MSAQVFSSGNAFGGGGGFLPSTSRGNSHYSRTFPLYHLQNYLAADSNVTAFLSSQSSVLSAHFWVSLFPPRQSNIPLLFPFELLELTDITTSQGLLQFCSFPFVQCPLPSTPFLHPLPRQSFWSGSTTFPFIIINYHCLAFRSRFGLGSPISHCSFDNKK